MSNHQDDLDLLLSLQDRVLETPPGSPSPGFLSDDDESPRRRTRESDMSVFKDAVQDCLDYDPEAALRARKLNQSKKSNNVDVEKFSGLRLKNSVLSPEEMSNHFSDIRFVRLQTIKNLLVGDTLSGCWATVGVLTGKGNPRVSSAGKSYCIWKISCLDENTVSVFLFGDAYQRNCKEQAGTVFAFFNCSVRKDAQGPGFSLSVFSAGQVLKMGDSVDYGVCKGKRKDGMACTLIINKRGGIYCKYHKAKSSEKYSVTRTELKGGNLKTAFRDPLRSEGIYVVDPLADKLTKPLQPVKLLSVDHLKKALSNAGKVTTNAYSQGIRFLTEVTGKARPNKMGEVPKMSMRRGSALEKRPSSVSKRDLATAKTNRRPDTKKLKTEQIQTPAKQASEKMIELEWVSSDEEN